MTDAGSTRSVPVTIGLPVYNGENYLELCLDALLAQDYGDFELLISDNASTDRTEEICRERALRDRRIRYIRQPQNRGVAFNFNSVFEASNSAYFKWATHDDVCLPDYLGACVDILDQAPPSVVLAYPRTTLVDANGEWLEDYEDGMDLREECASDRLRHLLQKLRFCHCALGLIRCSALAKTRLIGGYESADIVLLAELALLGEFHEHQEFLYQRRIHDASSFGNYSSAQAYAERMDPSRNTGRRPMPRTRLYVESSRAINRAPISTSEKLRCHRILLENWGPRFWRVIAGEVKRRLRSDLGRLRSRASDS